MQARHEQGQVLETIAQRRQLDDRRRQPEVEILPELLRRHQRAQVAIGRRDDTHVDPPLTGAANPAHRVIIQHAQQARLQLQRQLANLVQEQDAALRAFEGTRVIRVRAGEGTSLVTEQLALDQIGRNGAAIKHHERRTRAGADAVNEMRENILAGARLAGEGQGHVSRSELADQRIHLPHRRRDGGEVIAGWHRGGRQRRKLRRRTTCWTQARF